MFFLDRVGGPTPQGERSARHVAGSERLPPHGSGGGGSGSVKFPSMNYPESFEVVRTGCAGGWIVFQIPKARRPQAIAFTFDDTGDQGSLSVGGRHPEVHDHFTWTLG